jgi:DNA ligase 1
LNSADDSMRGPIRHNRLSISILLGALVACPVGMGRAGETSTPPALLLANELRQQIDPAKYLISEKYDGVRAM